MNHARLCLVLALAVAALPAAAERPPNFVVILTDDQGYDEWQATDARIHTPQLMRLAREGFVLENFHAMATCSPARASLLTGRATQRHGVTRLMNHRPGDLHALDRQEVTIAERLQGAGYTTGLVGKWHLSKHASTVTRHGFGSFYGFTGGATRYVDPDNFHRNGRALGRLRGYSTDLLADEAVEFIELHHKRPFFLLFAPNAPHTIAVGLPRDLAHYPEAAFSTRQRHALATISSVDRALGRIRKRLEAHGIAQDTIIIVTSDNGSDLRPRAKGTLHHHGTHVPFVAWAPGRIRPGASRQLAGISDLHPSMLEWAALEPDPNRTLDGRSLVELVSGRDAAIHELLFREWAGAYAAFDDHHRLILEPDPIYHFRAELYRTDQDPDETNNLMLTDFRRAAPVFARLRNAIESWQQSVRADPAFRLPDFIE